MKRRSNILLIMTDQMRADAMGCSGGWVQTPNLDNLAENGIRYTRAYTNCPLCAPARLSLMVGQYPHQTGVWNNEPHTLSVHRENWVKDLKRAGYITSVFGKTHLYPHNGSIPDMREAENLLHRYGFDFMDEIPGPRVSVSLKSHMTARWDKLGLWEKMKEDYSTRFGENRAIARASVLPEGEYPDVYVGNKVFEYLQNYDMEEPWFCFLSFGGPHEPWDAPDSYSRMYENTDIPKALKPFEDVNPFRPRGRWDEDWKLKSPGPDEVRNIRKNYAGNVTLIDRQIGRILSLLKERNEYDETYIIFTSDHGEMNGDHGRLYKSNFLDSSVRIPLIIKVPGNGKEFPHKINESLVELMDLGPTLVRMAGGTISYSQEGYIIPYSGEKTIARESVLSEINNERMIFDGEWKMVVNREDKIYMLFNLKDDPEEQENMAGCPEVKDVESGLTRILKERRYES